LVFFGSLHSSKFWLEELCLPPLLKRLIARPPGPAATRIVRDKLEAFRSSAKFRQSDMSFTARSYPNKLSANGTKVTFKDIPEAQRREVDVDISGYGVAHVIVIDTQRADKTTRQHGIAWRVNNRIIGSPGWIVRSPLNSRPGRAACWQTP
jgi:hypothetical protein